MYQSTDLNTTNVEVCDECLLVADDAGIKGYTQQANAMILIGEDCEDHECLKYIEEDELCACPC